MTYEDTLKDLSDGTARVVGQLWEAVEQGRLPLAAFHDLAADLVAIANTRGAAYASLALRGYLEAVSAAPAALVPTGAPDDRTRLHKALGTVLASEQDTAMQLQRLAANEPVQAATNAFQEGMERSPRVSGWRRGLEGGACQLCRWWHREGRVFRTGHRMPRHPGCSCTQIPVVNETTTNYQTEKQARRAATTRKRTA